MTPQQRLNHLLADATVPSNRGRLTHTWIAENVSLAVADGVYDAINAQSVPTAMRFVTGNGIDTTAALWKAQATAVAAGDESLAPHLVLLRDFESVYMPRWQVEGIAVEPTLESVQAEIDREALSPIWTAKKAVVDEGIFNGTITTLEQIIAAIEGV